MEKNVLPEINDVFTQKEITALLKQRVFVPPESLFSAPELISQTSCLKSIHNTASCRHGLRGNPPLTLSRKPPSHTPVCPGHHHWGWKWGILVTLPAPAQRQASCQQLPATLLQGDESPLCINISQSSRQISECGDWQRCRGEAFTCLALLQSLRTQQVTSSQVARGFGCVPCSLACTGCSWKEV